MMMKYNENIFLLQIFRRLYYSRRGRQFNYLNVVHKSLL